MEPMRIIGVMTGNSMDAIDCVLTEFSDKGMKDIATYSIDFSRDMREKVDHLRFLVNDKQISMEKLNRNTDFNHTHDEYIQQVADSINQLVLLSGLKKSQIDAIGFHGKTLAHLPPSIAKRKNQHYTLQIGSGQMLADLTGIRVIYDFRSDDIIADGEGAPLAPPHNAHIAQQYDALDSIFSNAGNTANLSIIQNGKAIQGWDTGPFNDFTDKLVRTYTDLPFDIDAQIGRQGKLLPNLLAELFERSAQTSDGKNYYDLQPEKSADPAHYKYAEIEAFQNPKKLADIIHTTEYFAAYIVAHSLQYAAILPPKFILFGGGWNNPICLETFKKLLRGEAYILPQHVEIFQSIRNRFNTNEISITPSDLGKYMEARLMGDLAYSFLTNQTWTTPELTGCKHPLVLGISRMPGEGPINDKINRAAKGWQKNTLKSKYS